MGFGFCHQTSPPAGSGGILAKNGDYQSPTKTHEDMRKWGLVFVAKPAFAGHVGRRHIVGGKGTREGLSLRPFRSCASLSARISRALVSSLGDELGHQMTCLLRAHMFFHLRVLCWT